MKSSHRFASCSSLWMANRLKIYAMLAYFDIYGCNIKDIKTTCTDSHILRLSWSSMLVRYQLQQHRSRETVREVVKAAKYNFYRIKIKRYDDDESKIDLTQLENGFNQSLLRLIVRLMVPKHAKFAKSISVWAITLGRKLQVAIELSTLNLQKKKKKKKKKIF
jgi:hypothetical protein